MIAMVKNLNKNFIESNEQERDNSGKLNLEGFGIISLPINEKVHILYQKGMGAPLIQNVIELCRNDLEHQKQGNSIIPIDDSTIFVHYFQNKNELVVILYMIAQEQEIRFPKLYVLTKKISVKFRLNAPISEIKELCEETLQVPQIGGIIGIFIMGSSGCPYFTKINQNRKVMSNKQVHIGGFISALYSFAKEIIGTETGAELKEINFGNQRFYMITKNEIIFAFLVEKLNKIIERYMYVIADEFLQMFRENLTDFGGDVSPFIKFESIIDQYFEI